jgi:hypothetical protein
MKEILLIGQKVYTFSENTRYYGEDRSAPIYEKHFTEHTITGENEKEYLVDKGYRKINKRSNLMDREPYFTLKQKEDRIYIHENKYKISRQIERLNDVDKLKQIDKILNNH